MNSFRYKKNRVYLRRDANKGY